MSKHITMRAFVSSLTALAGATALAAAAAVSPAASPQAAPAPRAPAYTDPAQAGPDFVDQGEYTNAWGGAQVIALGDGKFRLVTYKGGLPGAGWDQSPPSRVEGQRENGRIVFAATTNGFQHSLAGGTLTTTRDSGERYTMSKITRSSPTLGARPPAGALVLFDGSSTEAWQGARRDERRLLAAGTRTKRSFTNFTLHVEFVLPFKPLARGQDRGNSGVYLQERYEVQILDSFGLEGRNNECGGLYKQTAPAVNACFPPLAWQTYDIEFAAPQFDETGRKTQNAVVTVRHNGILIHDRVALKGPTGGGKKETAAGGPIQLQGHGNPVYFRNIWVVEK
jgi:hypothetical protein